MNLIQNFLSNKHTSGAAIVFAGLKVGSRIASIWFPARQKDIQETADVLEGFAVLYLGIAAGDAAQSRNQIQSLEEKTKTAIDTGDTTSLDKSKQTQ